MAAEPIKTQIASADIVGATGTTCTMVAADAGTDITVVETFTAGAQSVTQVSNIIIPEPPA